MAKAYSYIRFSTPDQIKGDSLRRQLELSERYVRENNLTLDTSLTLHDLGLSAFHGKNLEKGALGAFLAAVDQGRVRPGSFLLVESLDRLSRAQVIDALSLFTSILNSGITIVTLSDGQVYSRESIKDNWTGLIFSIAVMARAHEESAMKSKRLLAAWAQKVNEARTGGARISKTCPAWLTLSDDKLTFVPIPERVLILKKIFKMASDGVGTYIMERYLNQENVPVMGKSSHWHRSYLIQILTNRAVIGEYQYLSGRGRNQKAVGDPISDYYPAVISEKEFYAVQKILSAKRRVSAGRKGKSVPNILSGLCKCGYCGATMNYINKGDYDSLKFIVCSTAKRGIGCRYIPWRYSEIERLVLNLLTELEIEDISKEEGESSDQLLIVVQGRLERLRLARTNLITAIETAPDVAVLVSRLVEVEREIESLRKQEQELDSLCKSGHSLGQRVQNLKMLREQMVSLTGDELIRLRLRILSELKQILEWVKFFPDGIDPSSSSEYAMFSNEDVKFHGLGQGKDHRYLAMRFNTSGKTRLFFLKGIEGNGGIEKFAEDTANDDAG